MVLAASATRLPLLPPQGARHADLVGRLKAVIQQTKSVKLQQPLAFLDVALASRHVLGVPGVHQKNLQTMLLEHLKHRHPIHARGLHGYTAHPLLHQPLRHRAQVSGKAAEGAHRLRVPLRAHRHPMLTTPNINPCGVWVHNLQCLPIYLPWGRLLAFACRLLASHLHS